MLAPEELLSLRAIGEASLSGRCDILRKTRVRQPNASWKDVNAPVATGVPCRKVPTGQTPGEQALLPTTLGARGVSTFVITGDIPVYKDDIIRYPATTGIEYGVIGIYERTDGIYTRVIVYDNSSAPVAP